MNNGEVTKLLSVNLPAFKLDALTLGVLVVNPAVVTGVPVPFRSCIVPPWLCVNTILPAELTLALTEGTPAALTALIKLATVPVPPMVTVALVVVEDPASVAYNVKVFPTTNAAPVGVVVPVTMVAPNATRSKISSDITSFGV